MKDELIPWVLTLPAPPLVGLISDNILPPKQATDNQIRIKNAIAIVPLGISTYFSWNVVLSPDMEISTLPRVLAGITGSFYGLGILLALVSAISKGPFVRGKTDLEKVFKKIPEWAGISQK